jgi:hypothetical protein
MRITLRPELARKFLDDRLFQYREVEPAKVDHYAQQIARGEFIRSIITLTSEQGADPMSTPQRAEATIAISPRRRSDAAHLTGRRVVAAAIADN